MNLPENQMNSDVFKGCRKRTMGGNAFITLHKFDAMLPCPYLMIFRKQLDRWFCATGVIDVLYTEQNHEL